jgi:hypothetical protein
VYVRLERYLEDGFAPFFQSVHAKTGLRAVVHFLFQAEATHSEDAAVVSDGSPSDLEQTVALTPLDVYATKVVSLAVQNFYRTAVFVALPRR